MATHKTPDFTRLNERLNTVVNHFEETLRKAVADKKVRDGTKVFGEAFKDVRHLLTYGVTGEGIRNLLRREARETLDFYTSRIDFAELRRLTPFKRIPVTAWKIFAATAYRLSPPRRVAFAIATFAVMMGLLYMLLSLAQPRELLSATVFWWSIALVIYVLLLLMELRDKLDLKRDLEIAREIQLSLVPSGHFQKNKISIYSQTRPANTVGGDYDDIIALGEDRIGIVMGDVAGKGMPAALLMALLQGSLRTLITAGLRGSELIRRLNEYLCDNIPSDKLVTLFYCELDTTTGDLRYVNAGHNAPFLLRPGQATERLSSTSVVLGVLREATFESTDARLEPGQRLLLFTDGLSEAFNPSDEEYGEEQLGVFLKNNSSRTQEDLVTRMIKAVLEHCGPTPPTDDMTIMSVERN